ncbi:TUP1-like enhancer of split-domain-containing protein [Lipomyces japonicus]|uniref:TUP1-like enhancer of split-domain-containing protein n=1 Tax=Lipomyces japonicus TaxID=56871 RepID=UPI0034CF45F0
MYYIKPSWLTHAEGSKDFEIYSIHVHPDGTRLATGGLDSKVRIWSTAAIYYGSSNKDSSTENEYPGPKQLCSMSTHSGAVTVVRFSPSGRYLASGSDDRVILVWEREEDGHDIPRKEFGSAGEADTERWIVRRRCVGHDNDVQDLAWAADSSILVSVGLDSGIIIWSGTTFEKVKRLDIHQSHVKGITFDPANKYFATASDDRTIKIVRYHRNSATDMTFSVEATVKAPFKGSPLTTYFRRCSWSPDGSHIAAANSTNGPVATVAIINRGVWDSEINLVGHEGPVEVAAFSPRMFAKAKGAKHLVTVIACAGQDKSLSIWNTSHPRPIVVSHEIAEKAITDLAWAPDGQKLFASSLDGSIGVCIFEEGDLGYMIPVEENEKQLAKYGGGRDTMHFPESVEQLSLEDKSTKEDSEQNRQRLTSIMEEKDAIHATSIALSSSVIASSSNGLQESTPRNLPANGSLETLRSVKKSESSKITSSSQKVTITKEGRKRVTPLLVSSTNGSSASAVGEQQVTVLPSIPPQNVVQYSGPSDLLPQGGIHSLIIGNKRKLNLDQGQANSHKKHSVGVSEIPQFIRPSVVAPAVTISQVRLAIPKIKTILSISNDGSTLLFEVRNGSGGEKEPTRVILYRKGQILWCNFLPKMVLLSTGNSSFWATACEDATVQIFSSTGRVLIPAIVLESTPSYLDSNGKYLMCLTSTGTLYVWDMSNMTSPHPPVSVAPILDAAVYSDSSLHKAPSIVKCSMTSTGSVFITLSNGDGYTYSSNMYAWHRISESWWAVASQYWDSSGIRSTGGPVSLVEHSTDIEVKRAGRGRFLQRIIKSAMMRDGYEGIETAVSIAHLENRIGAAILLNSKTDLQSNLIIYARRIAEEGLKDRVEELYKELFGPMEADTSEANAYQPTICGLDKKELLKQIIVTSGKQREVQRISIPYAKLLGVIDDQMEE